MMRRPIEQCEIIDMEFEQGVTESDVLTAVLGQISAMLHLLSQEDHIMDCMGLYDTEVFRIKLHGGAPRIR